MDETEVWAAGCGPPARHRTPVVTPSPINQISPGASRSGAAGC